MTPLKPGNLFVNRLAMNGDEQNESWKVFEFENGSGDATVEDENLTQQHQGLDLIRYF